MCLFASYPDIKVVIFCYTKAVNLLYSCGVRLYVNFICYLLSTTKKKIIIKMTGFVFFCVSITRTCTQKYFCLVFRVMLFVSTIYAYLCCCSQQQQLRQVKNISLSSSILNYVILFCEVSHKR